MSGRRVLIMGHAHGRGGAQTAFRQLVEVCGREGYGVRAVVLNDGEPLDSAGLEAACLGIVPLAADGPGKRLKKIWRLAVARRRARRWKPDVAVAVGLNQSTRFIAGGLGRSCFKIAQDFIHGREGGDPDLQATAKIFDALAVQAPSMVAALRASGFSACPVGCLPCFPIPPERGICRVAPAERKSVRLGFFGRLAGNKGLSLLIEAWALANFQLPAVLDLWGEGAEKPALLNLIREKSLSETVSLRGAFPSGRTGAELMAGYDGMVLTSTGSEGLPLILLEALAYGLPILATNVGAIPDCCLGNPDAVLTEPGLEPVRRGLETLVDGIVSNRFDPARAQRFYERSFSHPVMTARWRTCLDHPRAFFGLT